LPGLIVGQLNRSILGVVALFTVTLAAVLVPVYANDPVVTVRLTNTVTGDIVWEETFAVADGTYTIEVPRPLLGLLRKAFDITAFGPGHHAANVGANMLTVDISDGLSVTFAPRPDGRSISATDVQMVRKQTLRQSKAPKGKPTAPSGKPTGPAATGILGSMSTGDKYAIIVGISDYPGTMYDLNYADDDALDMKRALTELYGYSEANIFMLVDADATRAAILDAIQRIAGLETRDDEVVFFFSGHGASGTAADGDRESVDEAIVSHEAGQLSYVWDGELRLWFSSFETRRIIFAFDSCVAGGMTDLAATGRVIAMATTETTGAVEGDQWQNGEFTYYFVDKGMLSGLADKYDHDGNPNQQDVTVEEAFDYAKSSCVWQTPTISDSFRNDLLL
jgi:hypothetical protein